MKKRNALPKVFERMLQDLERLDHDLGISLDFHLRKTLEDKKREERKQLLKTIWESWPRKTLLNKDVLQMRANGLKNLEVKAILNKYHIGIEDCALISFVSKRHRGEEDDCPGFCSPEFIRDGLIKWKSGNRWSSLYDYYWGGPKDRIKILFELSKNNRFRIIGLIEMFPERKAA